MKNTELIKESKAPETVKLQEVAGYLFARLHAIGTKSEGPLYYLQLEDGREVPVFKKVHPWQNDPVLHPWLGRKVVVAGKEVKTGGGEEPQSGLEYAKVFNANQPLELDLKLSLPDDTLLLLNRLPGRPTGILTPGAEVATGPVSPPPEFPQAIRQVYVYLLVRLPFREVEKAKSSIWQGECPTSQFHDFQIEDPQGKTIWQWSNCMLFRDEATQVHIPCGSVRTAEAPWFYFEDSITQEGVYVLSARFIASGQEIRKPFRVEFGR